MLLSKEFTENVTQIYPKRILNKNETNMELQLISIYHKEHFKHSSTRETLNNKPLKPYAPTENGEMATFYFQILSYSTFLQTNTFETV